MIRLCSYSAFYLQIKGKESRRADSNRLPLLITSVRSVVAERCRSLHIPHKEAVFYSLDCPVLQSIASGLGSNLGQIVSVRRGLRIAGSSADRI
jgi:hypothetical protein